MLYICIVLLKMLFWKLDSAEPDTFTGEKENKCMVLIIITHFDTESYIKKSTETL